MVTTVNDFGKLPPELTHPGRVDEKFFCDLTAFDERYQIAMIQIYRLCQLRAIHYQTVKVMANYLAGLTAEYTGAEIEQIIKSAARRTSRQITEESLLQAAQEITPISRSSNIKELRQWAMHNLRMANDQPVPVEATRVLRKEAVK